jgi:TolB-like protein
MKSAPDIFLSYSREDQATARRFAEGFEKEGFKVWWDQTLRSGENYDQVTERALREAKAVVVLWSKTSVESRWVRAEATQADRLGTLVPAMIEDCTRPIMFELKHTAELAHWQGDARDPAWRAYVEDVRGQVGRGHALSQTTDAATDRAGTASASVGAQSRPPRSPATWLMLVFVGVALIGAGLTLFVKWRGEANGTARAGSLAAAKADARPSLAVLPFANLSGDPAQEYFSDGLAEEILNELAQIRGLRLIARTSSFAFKGKNEDMRAIGQTLDVANLLEGSVRRDGDTLRITAQLIDAANGSHRWSKTYDGKLAGVFALQEEVARDVAQALSITLDVGELSRARGGTNDVGAHDAYLRARAVREAGGPGEDLEQAIDHLREAVRLDPQFARAWLGIYDALARMKTFRPTDAGVTEEQARILERLEAIAPESPWTLRVRSLELQQQRRWSEAEIADRQFLAVAPVGSCSTLDANVGRSLAAARCGELETRSNPLSASQAGYLQILLESAGKSAEAAREYQRIRALVGERPEGELFELLRMWRGSSVDLPALKQQYRKVAQHPALAQTVDPALADHLEDSAFVLSRLRQWLRDPEAKLAARYFMIAVFAAHYGDLDLAFDALRKRVEETNPSDYFIYLWWPYENGLRSDPRFKQLVKELGLVDYWRASGSWGDHCKPVGTDDFECR